MPNILLVPVQTLMKLTQKPVKEISTCVAKRIPTNLGKSVKLFYRAYNMFSDHQTISKNLSRTDYTRLLIS